MAKQKKRCSVCGFSFKGKKCQSEVCRYLRRLHPSVLPDHKIWTSVAMLSGQIGNALGKQGAKDNDQFSLDMGERIVRWSFEALLQARSLFSLPKEYTEQLDGIMADRVAEIWGTKRMVDLIHAADVVQNLISDVIDHFSEKLTPDQMACWNWSECAYSKLLNETEGDVLDYVDVIESDYSAFRCLFWGESPSSERRLKMYSVDDRKYVAAYTKGEARKIANLEQDLPRRKIKNLVDTAKVNYNGQPTPCGMLLELFNSPGVVAEMREVA